MAISIQTLASASTLLSSTLLVDSVDLYDVGELVTSGIHTERALTLVTANIKALIQTTTLQNAVESATDNTYSIKVPGETDIQAGQAIKVRACSREPSLVGKTLYLDKVSQNGLALIRKAVAGDTYNVDRQGTEVLS